MSSNGAHTSTLGISSAGDALTKQGTTSDSPPSSSSSSSYSTNSGGGAGGPEQPRTITSPGPGPWRPTSLAGRSSSPALVGETNSTANKPWVSSSKKAALASSWSASGSSSLSPSPSAPFANQGGSSSYSNSNTNINTNNSANSSYKPKENRPRDLESDSHLSQTQQTYHHQQQLQQHHYQGPAGGGSVSTPLSKSASPVLGPGSFSRTHTAGGTGNMGGNGDSSSSTLLPDGSSSSLSSTNQTQHQAHTPSQPLRLDGLVAKFADAKDAKERYANLLSPALSPSTTFQEKNNNNNTINNASSNPKTLASMGSMGSFATPPNHIKVQRTTSLHYTPNM
ncbi:hypothetical protein BG004_008289, partial [Podila humilis]